MRSFVVFLYIILSLDSFASSNDTTYYKLVKRRNVIIKDYDYCMKIDSTIYFYSFTYLKGDYEWRSYINEIDNKNIGLPIVIPITNYKNYSIIVAEKSILINNNKLKKIKKPLDILFIQKSSVFNFVNENLSLFVENYNNLSNEEKYKIRQGIPIFNYSVITSETLNFYFENVKLKLN